MSTSCGCFRFWLDDEEATDPGSIEQLARAEHFRVCPDCRREMEGIIAQRAAVRGVFRSREAAPPLSEELVARCVGAMTRAALEARAARDVGHSAG